MHEKYMHKSEVHIEQNVEEKLRLKQQLSNLRMVSQQNRHKREREQKSSFGPRYSQEIEVAIVENQLQEKRGPAQKPAISHTQVKEIAKEMSKKGRTPVVQQAPSSLFQSGLMEKQVKVKKGPVQKPFISPSQVEEMHICCKRCDKTFKDKTALEGHEKMHLVAMKKLNVFICFNCSKICPSIEVLTAHEKTHVDEFQTEIIDLTEEDNPFRSQEESNVAILENQVQKKKSPAQKQAISQEQVKKIVKVMSKKNRVPVVQQAQSSVFAVFCCTYCDKPFATESHWKAHELEHLNA